MSHPDPWQGSPGQPGSNEQPYPGQAPLFPQGQYPPASYPPVGYTQPSYPQPAYPQAGYPQAGYPPAGYPPAGYPQPYGPSGAYAPFGIHPLTGEPLSDKTKVVAGLLSIFFGYFGIGRFYAGNTGLAVAQLLTNLVLTFITLGFWLFAAWIWPLIDGIVLLTGSPRDGMGRPLR